MNINKINPATLKITDMRFADIDGTPKRCTLLKLRRLNRAKSGPMTAVWG